MTGYYSLFLAAILGLSQFSAVVKGSDCGCIEKALKQHACSSEFGKVFFYFFNHRGNIKIKFCGIYVMIYVIRDTEYGVRSSLLCSLLSL